MEAVRKRLLVRGKVQGVWFRGSTHEAAERIGGLRGWVRNLDDGSVEAVVQGPPDAVDALVAYCREGPEAAEVETVHVEDEAPREDEAPFHVRR